MTKELSHIVQLVRDGLRINLRHYRTCSTHFENIIADTTKRTNKATLKGKRRQLQKADVLLLGALFFDLLQEENVNLIKIVNSIDSTRNDYQRLLNRIEKSLRQFTSFREWKPYCRKLKALTFSIQIRIQQLLTNTKTSFCRILPKPRQSWSKVPQRSCSLFATALIVDMVTSHSIAEVTKLN